MSTTVPVDVLPEFEGLSLRSSALMIEAKAHIAKGEPFDAALAWVKAGRSFADLAQALLAAGHVRETAEDVLNAARCFLEAGDHRPADRVLQRFEDYAQLREVVSADEPLAVEQAGTVAWSGRRRRELDQARAELQRQMGQPDAAHKLSHTWLSATLAAMPGVADFHWFAAQKAWSAKDYETALEHYAWCARLNPENARYWCVRIHDLVLVKRFDEAVAVADEAVVAHPSDAIVLWFAGWARLHGVIDARRPKSDMARAQEYFEQALGLNMQLTERQVVATKCALCLCLKRLGQLDAASTLLRNTIRDHPLWADDLARRMLRAHSARVERDLIAEVPRAMLEAAA
jgi:tetratricopeptide (TPR) repeat protein